MGCVLLTPRFSRLGEVRSTETASRRYALLVTGKRLQAVDSKKRDKGGNNAEFANLLRILSGHAFPEDLPQLGVRHEIAHLCLERRKLVRVRDKELELGHGRPACLIWSPHHPEESR